MKRIVHPLLALLLGVLVCLSAVGCHQSKEESTPTGSTTALTVTTTTSSTTADTSVSATDTTTSLTTTAATSTTTITKRRPTTMSTSVTTTTTSPTLPYPHIALDSPALKYTGRTLVTPGEVYLDWSASGVELAVTGGSVEMQLYSLDLGEGQRNYMAVYVDGQRTKTFPLSNGLAWYTLAENLPENKVSTLRLVRLTEASMGKTSLFDLKVTGKLAARPADRPHRIEWIGDSLTCGYGVLGGAAADPFLASTEDVTKTFAWLCSEALNADISVVACSGYGVGSNCAGEPTQLMPEVFPVYNSVARDIVTPWDYALFQPELVVVNLGTNDFNGCQGSGTGATRIKVGTEAFLTTLRKTYPQATICWVYGFCGDGYGDLIRQTVERFNATDGNAAYIAVTVQNVAKNGYGSVFHPNAASNEDCAAELLPRLKKLMNW